MANLLETWLLEPWQYTAIPSVLMEACWSERDWSFENLKEYCGVYYVHAFMFIKCMCMDYRMEIVYEYTPRAIHKSVKVRCTIPKTVDTRRHCKVGLRACNNLLQPQKPKM